MVQLSVHSLSNQGGMSSYPPVGRSCIYIWPFTLNIPNPNDYLAPLAGGGKGSLDVVLAILPYSVPYG